MAFDFASILDNTAKERDYKELGIFKFARLFFSDRFIDEFAPLHYKMCKLLFKLLDPEFDGVIDRKAYFLVHREAAKTTIGTFLFPIYLIYLKGLSIYVSGEMLDREDPNCIVEIPIDERFIVIASATAGTAEAFVTNLKTVIETRSDLANHFGEKNPKMIEIDENDVRMIDKTWRKQMFVTSDGTVVRGVGMGQQIRGANIGGSRPTLIIADDIYSEDNSKTEYSRDIVKKWFFNAVENSLDSHKGKMLCLGTMMHPDSVFKVFQTNPFWFGIEVPIISEQDLHLVLDALKEIGHGDDDKWYTTQESVAWFETKQRTIQTLSWVERHNLRKIIVTYINKKKSSDLNWFYQEFMNKPIAPEMNLIQEHTFYKTKLRFYKQRGIQYVEFQFNQAMWYGPCNLYVGVDPASSISGTSDDTAIVVAGIAYCTPLIEGFDAQISVGKLATKVFPIIAYVEGGKYSIHDYEGLPGICERVQKLEDRFILEAVRVEANGQQGHIVRELRRSLQKSRLVEQYNTVNKQERVLSIVLSMAQKYKYIICDKDDNFINKIFYQLLTIGMADHDDYADALSIAWQDCREPYNKEFSYFAETNWDDMSRFDKLKQTFGDRAWEYL